MKRSILTTSALAIMAIAGSVQAAGKFTASDYQRALWMATRFYGGQRSGEGPNWLLIGMPDSLQKSFTRDTYQGADVTGGWFDCGDHAMFGQTQYWAAYSLAKAYETFPTGYDDLYNGADYSDYKENGKWNDVGGGKPNGIPDIIDELVYEADYIAKAAISKDVFISLKGDPDKDHQRWVTAGMMSQLNISLGGECVTGGEEKYDGPNWTFIGNLTPCTKYGSRSILADKDRSMASYGSATLAVMSRILAKLNIYQERATLYAQKAKVAYDAATATTGSVAYGNFYPANKNQGDDYATASIEMYLLTKENSYLNTAKANKSGMATNHNYVYNYNNNDDMAFYNLAKTAGDAGALASLNSYASAYKAKINSEGVIELGDATWGTLRYPLNAGLVLALADIANKDSSNLNAVYQQADFVMGANNAKQSYITGFQKDDTYKMPQHPHHRGVYQRNDNPDDNNKAKMTIPTKNQSHGALVGSQTFRSGTYKDDVLDYHYTEVCTDYNVGLVGALGYIVSKLAPVDTSKFGAQTSILPSRAVGKLSLHRDATGFAFRAPAGQTLTQVTVLDASGRQLWASSEAASEVRWSGSARSGLYIAQATAAGERFSTTLAVP